MVHIGSSGVCEVQLLLPSLIGRKTAMAAGSRLTGVRAVDIYRTGRVTIRLDANGL